jgi:hypothetical protein
MSFSHSGLVLGAQFEIPFNFLDEVPKLGAMGLSRRREQIIIPKVFCSKDLPIAPRGFGAISIST